MDISQQQSEIREIKEFQRKIVKDIFIASSVLLVIFFVAFSFIEKEGISGGIRAVVSFVFGLCFSMIELNLRIKSAIKVLNSGSKAKIYGFVGYIFRFLLLGIGVGIGFYLSKDNGEYFNPWLVFVGALMGWIMLIFEGIVSNISKERKKV